MLTIDLTQNAVHSLIIRLFKMHSLGYTGKLHISIIQYHIGSHENSVSAN